MTLIEAVCSCGYRVPAGTDEFREHMGYHLKPGELHHVWWIEHDGVDLDALSGAERRRRAARTHAIDCDLDEDCSCDD